MAYVVDGRLMNPDRAPRILGASGKQADQYFNYDEWGLPQGAFAEIIPNELPPNFASGARRIYPRPARSRGAPDHINPAGPEDGQDQSAPQPKTA